MIRAVIFDFDGLIVDTESPILQAWTEVFREHGCELPVDEWLAAVGGSYAHHPMDRLEECVSHPLDRAAVDAHRRVRQLVLVKTQPILPGVEARIAEAHALGLKLAVASSSSRGWVAGHLERLGLIHHFDAVRARTDPDVGVRKPDPTVYRAALRAIGVAANEAIAIEDSAPGVQAAKTAGIFTVAVPNDITRRLGVPGADLTLVSLSDMTLQQIIEAAADRRRTPA